LLLQQQKKTKQKTKEIKNNKKKNTKHNINRVGIEMHNN